MTAGGLEVAAGAGVGTVTLDALRTLREQIAPKASNEELVYFANVCNRLDLSPFADQIVLVGRWDKRAGREVHRHQITVAGRRTLASRTGRLAGIDGPVWCGPRDDNGGQLVWREVWDEDDRPPYCARCLVHVHGWTVPANGTAKWTEFAQVDSHGDPFPTWQKMPSHMLGKCAESMALRRAFPDVITPATVDGFVELPDVDAEAAAAVLEAEPSAPLEPADWRDTPASAATERPKAADWRPSTADQAAAHRAVAGLEAAARDEWLAAWRIDDFGAPWPPEAVADALAARAPSYRPGEEPF